MAVVKEKGREVYIPLAEARKKKLKVAKTPDGQERIVPTGEVYLENYKQERKATGSYYTPDYIVKYIVQHTVGPLLSEREEKLARVMEQIGKLRQKMQRAQATDTIRAYRSQFDTLERQAKDTLLDIKVLDPAMGSGHFLVEAVDYISDRVVEALNAYPDCPLLKEIERIRQDIVGGLEKNGIRIDQEKLTDTNLIKRMVMKRCIYGVDLNPMAVELAKLSLWLDSFTLGAPLSFLDHHLKCGNSLIGAKVAEVREHLATTLFGSQFAGLLSATQLMRDVGKLTDSTFAEVQESVSLYERANLALAPFKGMLDLWVSDYFGNKGAQDFLAHSGEVDKLFKDHHLLDTRDQKLVQEAKKLSRQKHFFHWELEFPEVFYDKAKKDNPGFDAVVGNPPYDVISAKEQGRSIDIVESEKKYFESIKDYTESIGEKLNYYRLFVNLSINSLKSGGMHGFIVPLALFGDKQARNLRKHLLFSSQILQIEAFPQKDDPQNRIFPDAKLSTCVYVLQKTSPSKQFYVRVHPGKEILESISLLWIHPEEISKFDPENYSIPSYPWCNRNDFEIALKLEINTNHNKLGSFAPSKQGEVNLTTHKKFISDNPADGQIILRGAHVNRYELAEIQKQGIPQYLMVTKFLNSFKKSPGRNIKADDHKLNRIGYQRGAGIDNWRRIIATTIEAGNFCSDTINYISNPNKYNLNFILGILNSSILEWRFRLTSTNNHVNSYEIDSLPIPKISFATPETERRQLVDESIAQYQRYLETQDQQPVLDFTAQCLAATPEQSDVIHDLLAHLAQQMLDLNKAKQEEVKGFLHWLEHEIGTGIDSLTNKTTIKDYHNTDFEKLLAVLKKNKHRLTIDPSSRAFHDRLEKEYIHSLSKLTPCKQKIQLTDRLIDQIVYQLYGLTNDEIKTVEESLHM